MKLNQKLAISFLITVLLLVIFVTFSFTTKSTETTAGSDIEIQTCNGQKFYVLKRHSASSDNVAFIKAN